MRKQEGDLMFGEMERLKAQGEHAHLHQQVHNYLAQHFTCLPHVDMYYDAKEVTHSETQRHQTIQGRLIVVQIHGARGMDAIGLLQIDGHLEMDAVSASCATELKELYGYRE